MLLELVVWKMRRYPSKVSKPHLKCLFPKLGDKDRSQWGWGMGAGSRGETKFLCSGEETGKEQMTSNCPVLSALYKSKTIPKSATQTLISFSGLNITSQNSPMALWSLPNVPVPFTFSCLWKCLMWHCKMTGKKFNSIIYYGTLMFYWMKPSAWECFPTLWVRSRIYSSNIARLREFHSRNATQCITNMWD